LPQPAERWLQQAGAELRLGQRVAALMPSDPGWRIGNEHFDAVLLACTAKEAARLAQPHAPTWAAQALDLQYEPIVTVYARCDGARLAAPMMALHAGPKAPAQFVFDHGALGGTPGLFAFVISGARPWVDAGLPAAEAAVLAQARTAFAPGTWPTPLTAVSTLAEKRATFACVPGLARPSAVVASGLLAAGDYIQGPYPATLEAAVRSGESAVALLSSIKATAAAQ
jgi:hydroxysqualene dehydroxylase